MDDQRLRLGVFGVVVATLFATLFARLSWLQLVESDKMSASAAAILQREAILPTLRGKVLDRNGVVLIDNRLTPTVEIDKKALPRRQRVAVLTRLAAVLDTPFVTLQSRLDARNVNELFPVAVAKGIRESAAIYIGEHADLFPGVAVTVRPERVYPQGDVGAHILGYVNKVDDVSKLPARLRYQGSDLIGRAGVEATFEETLRGVPGLERYIVDRRGRIRATERVADPVHGKDVYLTIDINVQRSCEESLRQGVEQARRAYDGDHNRNFLAPGGAAVVLDPVDGSIVCMASYPTFSPTDFINRNNAKIEELLKDEAGPLNNRAIQGEYAPGSTFKLVTAIAALRTGFIDETTSYVDEGKYTLQSCKEETYGCVFRNSGSTPYGPVDIRRALTVSSDVFFYWIGEHFWIDGGSLPRDAIQRTARDLGFGEVTGIQLPEEHDGRIPDEKTKAKLHREKPKLFPDGKWRTGDNVNTAIGQGDVLATPLQMAAAYGTFVNGGAVLLPRIAFEGNPIGPQAASVRPRPSLAPPLTAVGPKGTGSGVTTSVVATSSTLPTGSIALTSPPVPAADGGPAGATGGGRLGAVVQAASSAGGPATVGSATEATPTLAPTTLAPTTLAPTTTTIDPMQVALSRVPLTPVVRSRIQLPDQVRRPVLDGLIGVTGQEAGTAYDAFVGFPLSRFPIGAKTGTAQVGKKKSDNALFTSFGPVANPRFVVVVVLEEAGFGGQAAAPVARRIFERLIGSNVNPVVRHDSPRND